MENGSVRERARGVRRRSWLMIGEGEFGVRGVEFEKRARSKWTCLGGCWTWGPELNKKDRKLCYGCLLSSWFHQIFPQPLMQVVFLPSTCR